MKTIFIKHSIFILLFSLLSGGLLSTWLGKDLCWDIANYHYYNPYAYLTSRYTLDYWPSSFVHQFINPTIDLITYYLISLNHPLIAEFLLGAIHGMNFFLLYSITRQFNINSMLALFLAFCGIYGPTAWPGTGSFQNDNLISVFVLSYVYLQLLAISLYGVKQRLNKSIILFSGLVLGIGVGLKLTAAIYALGAIASICLFSIRWQEKIKWLICLGIGIAIGVMISSGHWLWLMWQQHHNPVFPFLNNIFHSTDFPAFNWRDERFLPRGVWQTVFYPFYFSFDGRIADEPFLDFRFAIVYLLFLGAIFSWATKKYDNKNTIVARASIESSVNINVNQQWLFLFFIFSYLIWQSYFSIARYLVPLEMLAPTIIFLLVNYIFQNSIWRFAVLSVLFYTLIFFMQPTQMIRARWYQQADYLNVTLPKEWLAHSKALVLMSYPAYAIELNPRPQTYLIPYFPKSWQFIGVPFLHETLLESDVVAIQKITQLIKFNQQNIYFITPEDNLNVMYKAVAKFNLSPNGQCEPITSDRVKASRTKVVMCPVRKLQGII